MLEIRKAYPSDAYQLININDMAWKSEFYDILPNGIFYNMTRNIDKRISHLRDQIEENNRIFVALEDEIPVGYVFYAKTQNVMYNAACEIRAIYILPEFQRRGIGSNLFKSVVDEVKKLGYKTLILYSPLNSSSISFFLKLGGEKKEIVSKDINGYLVNHDLVYFDLEHSGEENASSEWNELYLMAQDYLYLLNNINRELCIIKTSNNKMYLGLGIKNRVCPIESALSNMYIGEEKEVSKILILDRRSKPVLPCGKCRDLLIGLGQEKAEILFELDTFKTMTMKELNPYYKDEEKV